jgi:hypothetical protein
MQGLACGVVCVYFLSAHVLRGAYDGCFVPWGEGGWVYNGERVGWREMVEMVYRSRLGGVRTRIHVRIAVVEGGKRVGGWRVEWREALWGGGWEGGSGGDILVRVGGGGRGLAIGL